jgi:hypothetical protein
LHHAYPIKHHLNPKTHRSYPEKVVQQVQSMVDNNKLAEFLLKRHPTTHSVYNDSDLRVSSMFKKSSEALLNMIVVHELAHLKEKEHNKGFYRLCLLYVSLA